MSAIEGSVFTRREFLKVAGIGTAGALAAGGIFASTRHAAPAAFQSQMAADGVVPTFCEMCFWKCGALAHVQNGRVTKIVGNPADPLSSGRLCPRGTAGMGALYDPDRLAAPLIRMKSRGEDIWRRASWDEVLGYTAEKLDRVRKEYGPEAVGLFFHGFGGSWFKHLASAMGTPNTVQPSFAQCRGPRDVGFTLTFGEPIGSPERCDIQNARFLVLLGSHLGENMHNTPVQEFAEAIGRGAKIAVVDPRFSTAASKATYWLPIRPGADIALLLAWMNVILTEGLYDKDYVARYTTGLEELSSDVASNTPEWAYPHTGIEPEVIRSVAREMAANKPNVLIYPGRHVTWYGDDTQRSRAIAILSALLGSWGRPGGFYLPGKVAVPKIAHPPYPKPAKDSADGAGTRFPFAD